MRTLRLFFRNKSLRKRCFLTVLVLIIIRLFNSVPTPGVNPDYFKAMISLNGSLGFMNVLSGNGFSTLSVIALSISPYITASIVIQLLSVVFPKIYEMQTGMEDDRKKLERITIVVGAVLALAESIGMSIGFGRKGLLVEYNWKWVVLVCFIWTLSSTLLSIVGKVITDKKETFIGNGISLILFTNIVASFIPDSLVLYEMFIKGKKPAIMALSTVIIVVSLFALFLFTVYLQESEKKIKVVYSNKVSSNGRKVYSSCGIGQSTSSIPIKVCQGGVVPVIFASSIFGMPVLIAQFLGKSDNFFIKLLNTNEWFNLSDMKYSVGAILYVALIFIFSYFYSEFTFNPADIADKLRKNGGTISGVRAGKPTEDYLRKQVKVLIAIGATGLSLIALIPIIIGGILNVSKLSFMGTSIIIVIGVILETKKLIVSAMQCTLYKKGGLFHG